MPNAWDAELYEARHAFVWKFGEGVLDLLDPKPGEQVLDLGCGTGQLTQQIAERGAKVVGLDASPEMIGQARQNYPHLRFVLGDAAKMNFQSQFDAVFSNAALHWMVDANAVASAISRALRPGGRLAAELGGRGNIHHIEEAIALVLHKRGLELEDYRRTFFPSIGEYASILEANHLEVRSAILFERPTMLEGESGMANWLRQFASYYFDPLPAREREQALAEVAERLRPVLFIDGTWHADYRRLRVVARKV